MTQIERDVYVLEKKIKNDVAYVQNTNAIPLIFHFRDFKIPAGATAQVFVQKPSGLAVYNAATISGNDVTVDVTTQMFAEVGFNKLQLQIMSGDDNLVTFVQPVNVFQNYTDGESEESKNESNLFDQLQEAAQAANTAAEAANSAAEEIEAKAEAGEFSSTVTVGSTTTGEPGSQASVTNSGTAQNPVLDFVIPTGAQGPQGPKGDPGSAENIDTTTVSFEQASTRENVSSGDTVATLFGKISKWFSDLGTAAFKGVSNVLTQTSDGYVLDARQGNALYTMIGVLGNLVTTAKTNLVAAINECAMEIGNLTALTTDEKTDIVSAINETNAGLSYLNGKIDKYNVSTGAGEILTGETFAGRPVYMRLVDIGVLPNNTSKTINTGITNAYYFWVDPTYSMAISGVAGYPLPYVDPANVANSIGARIIAKGQSIVVSTRANWSTYAGFVAVKYTKQ